MSSLNTNLAWHPKAPGASNLAKELQLKNDCLLTELRAAIKARLQSISASAPATQVVITTCYSWTPRQPLTIVCLNSMVK